MTTGGSATNHPHWEQLYAVQDAVARVLCHVEQEFYLTGGTALSRCYYGHRYSEDLDYFVNDREEFALWRDRCFEALRNAPDAAWRVEIVRRDTRFGRAIVHAAVDLKLEFVNDVPCRCGAVKFHELFGRIDTPENILSNKITALVDRAAPKDVADIFWLCCRAGLSLTDALEGATGKAAGIFPPLVAKRLHEAAARGVPDVMWCEGQRPSDAEFVEGLHSIIASITD